MPQSALKGAKINLRAESPDEKEAVNALCGIIENYI